MKWFTDRSIFTKIISGYAFTALVLVVGGVLAANRQSAMNATVRELGFDALPGMQHVGAARLAMTQFRLEELRRIATPAVDDKAKAAQLAQIDSELERYLPTATSDGERRA